MNKALKTVYIDCAGVTSGDELWRRYLDSARPDGADLFGRNLDAFWDAVEGGGPGYPGEVRLVFEHSHALAALRLRDGSSYLDHLRKMARDAIWAKIEFT
jgi:ribonuclease inhibitor